MPEQPYIMWFMDVGMKRYGLYPTVIVRAFCYVGEPPNERRSVGRDAQAIADLIAVGKRYGITGYPDHCSYTLRGKCDALNATPLYTNGAMHVEAITHGDRVIYGSLHTPLPDDHPAKQHPWTPWTAPVPGNERYQPQHEIA